MIPGPILDPNALIYMPYPRVNCLKTIPFTAAHTYIAHIWQYPPRSIPDYYNTKANALYDDVVEMTLVLVGHCGM